MSIIRADQESRRAEREREQSYLPRMAKMNNTISRKQNVLMKPGMPEILLKQGGMVVESVELVTQNSEDEQHHQQKTESVDEARHREG
jgi:hypothetical protein